MEKSHAASQTPGQLLKEAEHCCDLAHDTNPA
jgi:hypothetical protein